MKKVVLEMTQSFSSINEQNFHDIIITVYTVCYPAVSLLYIYEQFI